MGTPATAGAILGSGMGYTQQGVLNALSSVAATAAGTVVNAAASAIGPWRPPQWAKPALTTIRIPGTPGNTNSSKFGTGAQASEGVAGTPGAINNITTFSVTSSNTGLYDGTPDVLLVFDGVLKLQHSQRAEATEFPVQTGANLSDHIFLKPAQLTLALFVSDAMSSYIPGQFDGLATKSISAYATLKDLLQNRTPVYITTKLDSYPNMCLVSMETPDTYETNSSLRVTCVFQQLFMAQTSSNAVSARADSTDDTQLGSVPTLQVPDVVDSSYLVPPPVPAQSLVPYSGQYSSLPLSAGTGFDGVGADGAGAFTITGTDTGNPGTPP